MNDELRELVERVFAKHRRHIELSPGVGADLQRYALATLDDVQPDLERAILSRASGSEGAVAWLYRNKESGTTYFSHNRMDDDDAWEETPLYTHPAPAQQPIAPGVPGDPNLPDPRPQQPTRVVTCECERGPREVVEHTDAAGVKSWTLADRCAECLEPIPDSERGEGFAAKCATAGEDAAPVDHSDDCRMVEKMGYWYCEQHESFACDEPAAPPATVKGEQEGARGYDPAAPDEVVDMRAGPLSRAEDRAANRRDKTVDAVAASMRREAEQPDGLKWTPILPEELQEWASRLDPQEKQK